MAAARKHTALEKRKAPRQERSRATVEAILQAATYILVRRGYGGLTTNGIAERAGVNIASLYQYFPNKKAIVAEIYRRHVAAVRAARLAALTRADARPRAGRTSFARDVRRVAAAVVAAHAVAPELHRFFTQEGAHLGVTPAGEADAALAEVGRLWVERVRGRRENPELAFWVAMTAAHAVVHAAFVERPGEATSEALVDEIARLLARYLRV
jgi:AcrR family transcriptional regulator